MIAIIKYNSGNIMSVRNALLRLGCQSVITDDKDEITSAEKVILPGVGEAGSAMKYLRERQLDKLIISLRRPFLGICLGQQLMCRHSEEGNTDCLGIFDSYVRLFPKVDTVPHMGWNNFFALKGDLFKNVSPEENVYYVHSYYSEISTFTSAVCDYIVPFSAAMQKDNFYATQFHPEKSASTGEKILMNFLEL
jgi:imidazole glycerol-phosphate synthase subunit HisH